MGSQSKRLRKRTTGLEELRLLANPFVDEAVRTAVRIKSCVEGADVQPHVVYRRIDGWTLALSCSLHPEGAEHTGHFHLSAKPRRNASRASVTRERWDKLLDTVVLIMRRTGLDVMAAPDELPTSGDNDSTSHWAWHDSNNDIEAGVLRGIARTVAKVKGHSDNGHDTGTYGRTRKPKPYLRAHRRAKTPAGPRGKTPAARTEHSARSR